MFCGRSQPQSAGLLVPGKERRLQNHRHDGDNASLVLLQPVGGVLLVLFPDLRTAPSDVRWVCSTRTRTGSSRDKGMGEKRRGLLKNGRVVQRHEGEDSQGGVGGRGRQDKLCGIYRQREGCCKKGSLKRAQRVVCGCERGGGERGHTEQSQATTQTENACGQRNRFIPNLCETNSSSFASTTRNTDKCRENTKNKNNLRTFNNPRGIRKPKMPANVHATLTGNNGDPAATVVLMMSAALRKVENARASYMLVCVNSKRSNARSDSNTRTFFAVCGEERQGVDREGAQAASERVLERRNTCISSMKPSVRVDTLTQYCQGVIFSVYPL